MFKLFRRVNAFLEDWNGVEARPGVEKRPGVMERLDHLQHEVSVNSGKSLKDLAVHTKDAVTDLTTRLDDHLQTQHER